MKSPTSEKKGIQNEGQSKYQFFAICKREPFVPMIKRLPTTPAERRIYEAFRTLPDLSDTEKYVLQLRYLSVSAHLFQRAYVYSWLFHVGRTIVTVGSLIIPALLNLQGSDGNGGRDSIYWFVWVLSLLVTTSNGIMTLFKVDKKYYFLHTISYQLESEAWQYISLTGRYAQKGKDVNGTEFDLTHKELFFYFTYMMEKMIMKQVEEEYFKLLHDSELQKDGMPTDKLNNVLTPFMHSISETRTLRSERDERDGEKVKEGVDEAEQKTSAGFSQDSELMSAGSIGGGKETNDSKNKETPQKSPNITITIPENPPGVPSDVPKKTHVPKTYAPFWRTQGRIGKRDSQTGSK